MTRNLTNKEIVGEAMYSVRRSLNDNIPLPPMNKDGSFKTVNQMIGESRMHEWNAQKADEALIAEMDAQSTNDPEQIRWEKEQGMASKRRHVEYEIVIPDGIKAIFFIIIFVACVIFLFFYHAGG